MIRCISKVFISFILYSYFYTTFKIIPSLQKSSLKELRVYHFDCGQKYFSIKEIKDIIDLLMVNKYNYFELAIGNGGLRLLLDSMEIKGLGKKYESNEVKKAINYGNKKFYDCGEKNELTQKEMDEIIDYGRKKRIEIIPLLNFPGHMDALLKAMELLIGNDCAFKGSNRTIDILNKSAIGFVKKLIELYINYFDSKDIQYFNIGCNGYTNDLDNKGFKYLVESERYGYLIKYINEIVEMLELRDMTAIAFNGLFYYNNIKNAKINNKIIEFKKTIIISYWFGGNGKLHYASARTLSKAGFKILNTNRRWYYILGRNLDEFALKNQKYYIVDGAGIIPIVGAMVCAWTDQPWIKYEGKEIENIKKQIRYFAGANSYDKIDFKF